MSGPSSSAWLGMALLAGAMAIGTAVDPRPAPLVAERGGWQVVEADLHVHTRFSDGFLSPFDVVDHARRQGLGAVAITEHNVVFPAKIARWYAKIAGGPEVIVGEEITSRDAHLLAYGIEHAVSARAPVSRAIADVHAQGGVVVAAHPVSRYWRAFEPVLGEIDGVERVHPIAWRPRRDGFDAADLPVFWARARAANPRLFATGSSDYHAGPVLGLATTWIFARSRAAPDLLDAMRAGRTVVEDHDGARTGDPDCLAALERDPLPTRPRRDPRWDGAGPLDGVGRWMAWIGMIALVALRRERA